MSEDPKLQALQAHHSDAVDRILKILIDETLAVGGDIGEVVNILVSATACTLLNCFRADAIESTIADFNRHLGPRLEAVREQNAETIAKLEEASAAAELRQQGRMN